MRHGLLARCAAALRTLALPALVAGAPAGLVWTAVATASALAAPAAALPGAPLPTEGPAAFDIAPFALPNTPPGEVRFEEPRDVARIEVRFRDGVPARVGVQYLRRTWPETRLETVPDLDDPCGYGWMPIDDQFNGAWQNAATDVRASGEHGATITFRGLRAESLDAPGDDVTFRRTLGVRLVVPDGHEIAGMRVFTMSPPTATRLRVELDAGRSTPTTRVALSGYNARVLGLAALAGARVQGDAVELLAAPSRAFELLVLHMRPLHRRGNDDGHVTFALDADTFTVSLTSLEQQGPVWYAEQGVFVALAGDTTRFADYRRAIAGRKTLTARVLERPEQTYAGACNGQPRAQPVSTNLGCAGSRQRFRLEPNGDLVLHRWNVTSLPAADTPRYLCDGDARWFFALERRTILARVPDPAPVPAYTIRARDGDIEIEQRSLAVPLARPLPGGPLAPDASVVALVRFRFTNRGARPAVAELPLAYAQRSSRTENAYAGDRQDDRLVPRGPRDTLLLEGPLLVSRRAGTRVLRARWEGDMTPAAGETVVVFRRTLRPGERCELLLKVPFIALERADELAALARLRFDASRSAMADAWRRAAGRGATLAVPVAPLTSLHAAHLAHVLINDVAMPGDTGLVQTSVGTSTYGNFSNEACMVIHELDERGLHDDARRRLEVWLRYQGTAPQPGNFSDCDGMFYGAGGFEQGDYNQHHGWVLWCLGEHYVLSGDRPWLERAAPAIVRGCNWVFRQRRLTMTALPHSRGWERGFLPAGSLEDVTDFHYWLSTNAITWRGVATAARALAAIGHPEAGRLAREADAYRADLVRGFETMRRRTPLVRLRDGRWVPHTPSRLYWRGRDVGWIREVLEGSIYLLVSGLYDARSPEATWILGDLQDNLYVSPPYGYPMSNFEANWFDRGGFSIQPNLLAGLVPHLVRDEPEAYLRMLFNAWGSCYREEVDAMVEHPNPELGYSSEAHFKTSDEANAVSWLRATLVYADDEVLHFGRALPREWLADERPSETSGVSTRYGTVGVTYRAAAGGARVTATLDLALRDQPPRTLVRFRHPQRLPLRAVRVNGTAFARYDPRTNDVDLSGYSGRVVVEAGF